MSGAEAKGAANKKLTPKQLEAKMKREADKITKEEKAASRKEESHRKRLLKAVTKNGFPELQVVNPLGRSFAQGQ
jgi:hypothetical protein